jgi:hypothetical protein
MFLLNVQKQMICSHEAGTFAESNWLLYSSVFLCYGHGIADYQGVTLL